MRPEGASGEGLDVAADVSIFASRLNEGRAVRQEFGTGRGGYLYLIAGAIDANGTAMAAGDAANVTGAGSLELAAVDVSELLIVDTPV